MPFPALIKRKGQSGLGEKVATPVSEKTETIIFLCFCSLNSADERMGPWGRGGGRSDLEGGFPRRTLNLEH